MAAATSSILGASVPQIAAQQQLARPQFSFSESSVLFPSIDRFDRNRIPRTTAIRSSKCPKCKATISEDSHNRNSGAPGRRVLLAGVGLALGLAAAAVPPAEAGILSGSQGLEQAAAPAVPEVGLFKQIQEGNKKRQEAWDSDFEQSDLLKQLLKKSAENKDKNKKEILDKYCVRGSEWGVGDCAVKGLPESVESAQSTRKILAEAIDKLRGKQ